MERRTWRVLWWLIGVLTAVYVLLGVLRGIIEHAPPVVLALGMAGNAIFGVVGHFIVWCPIFLLGAWVRRRCVAWRRKPTC